jgi:hypothetical protein
MNFRFKNLIMSGLFLALGTASFLALAFEHSQIKN